jgi:predicted nucleotidyltransferase
MERAEQTPLDSRLPLRDLEDEFRERGVRLAICFGSQASDETHDKSDIDIAVEFKEMRPGDEGYNDAFFDLYGAVSEVLGTDDVDLVDVHSLSRSLTRTVFDDGVLLFGTPERVQALQKQVADTAERQPKERLDEAIERIDEHLA